MAIKAEQDSSFIKPEPDEDHPMRMLDDDDYEDTGELGFPDQVPGAWAARIPRLLFEHWSKIDEDHEIQLGVVRHLKRSDKYQIVLDPKVKYNDRVPKRYDFIRKNNRTSNTFVFSEKDMPGYRRKARDRDGTENGKVSHSTAKNAGVNKSKRFQPHYKRAIPKQTGLTAAVQAEAQCVAVDNEETRRLERAYQTEQESKKTGIEFLEGDPRQYTAAAQSGLGGDAFDNFVRATPANRTRPQENKAARMPKNELLDALYTLFKEFRYWPMSALRSKLNQPEHYLKETLGMIAELVRSGPFNATWKLKPENEERVIMIPAKEEAAPEDEAMGGDGNGDEGDTPGTNDQDMDDLPE